MLLESARQEEARAQLVAMQKVAPKQPETLFLQALLAFREQNYAGARDAIQLQLKAAPDNLPGLLLGGQIEYQLGSFAQAETALLAVLQREPDLQFARRLLVQRICRHRRRRSGAQSSLANAQRFKHRACRRGLRPER
jgi:predicted Zn-dependent protease